MENELGSLFYKVNLTGDDFDANLKKYTDKLKTFESDAQRLLSRKIHVDSNIDSGAAKAFATLIKSTNAAATSDVKAASEAQKLSAANLNKARSAEVAARMNNASTLSAQRLATEAERTSLAHQRLENASKRAADSQKNLNDKAAFTNKTFLNQKVIAYQLANALGTTFSLYAVGAFIGKLAQVRGEFELQQVAIRAIIRDKTAADKIFGQVKSLAVESPFQFKDLIGYTKQLAAFSIETDKLFDTTKRLADISSGLGVDMGRIVLAYGQVKAATVLRGCLGLGTPVKTVKGIIKAEDVKVGDELLNEHNCIVNVKELIRGNEQMYSVHQSHGCTYRVNENHILTLLVNGELKDVYVKDFNESYLGVRITDGVIATSSISIEKDTVDDYYGFVLDGNKRFQLGDGTVTHNTELRQFTEAGIPLVDKLAEKFSKLENKTVSAGDVFEKISNRMVSFKDVDQIFTDMTSSGGMFFEMQKKQAETLAGKISNLKDAYALMLNEIGIGSEGALKGGVDMVSSLMRNWKTVADVLKVVIAAYGAYRVSTMIIGKLEERNAIIKARMIVLQQAYAKTGIVLADAEAKVAAKSQLAAEKMGKFNDVLKANAVSLAIAAVVALGAALYDAYQSAHKLQNDLSEIFSTAAGEAKASIVSMDLLLARLKNSNMYSQERSDIISQLNSKYGDYLPALIKEGDSYDKIAKQVKNATEAILENAKMKAYNESQTKIEESLAKKLSDATDKAVGAATRKPLGIATKYTMSNEEANSIITGIFNTVRNNPKIASNANALSKTVQDALKASLSDKGVKWSGTAVTAYEDIFSAVRDYASAINEASKAEASAASQKDILSGKTKRGTSELAAINAKFALVTAAIDKNTYSGDAETRSNAKGVDILNAKNNRLREMISLYRALGNYGMVGKLESERKSLLQGSAFIASFNQKLMQLEGFAAPTLKASRLVEEGKTVDEIYSSIALKLSEVTAQKEQYNKASKGLFGEAEIARTENEYKLLTAISEKILGLTDKKKDKAQKSEDDKFAESIANQVSLIKEAKSKYDELSKSLGKTTSLDIIKKMFPNVKFEGDNVINLLNAQLLRLKNDHTKKAEDVKKSIAKDIRDIEQKGFITPFDKALDAFQKYIDDNQDKFDIYQKVLDMTGDEKKSLKIAFGVEWEGGDAVETLKNNLVKGAKKLQEEGKFKLDMEITYDNLLNRLSELPEKIKTPMENVEKFIKDKTTNSLLDRVKIFSEALPEGMGLAFDFSGVIAEMDTNMNKLQATIVSASQGASKSELEWIDRVSVAGDKAEQEKARKKVENMGRQYLEENLMNKQLWNDYTNMGEASYSEIARLSSELKNMQLKLMKDGNLQSLTGNKETSNVGSILGDLGNLDSVEALRDKVVGMLDDISKAKAYAYETGTSTVLLDDEETKKLKLALELIKSISSNLYDASQKAEDVKLDKALDSAKKLGTNLKGLVGNIKSLSTVMDIGLSDSAINVLDGIMGVSDGIMGIADAVVSYQRAIRAEQQISTALAVGGIAGTAVAANGAVVSTSLAAATSIKMVESASVILAIISLALTIAMSIANIITGNKAKAADEAISRQKAIVDSLKVAFEELEKAASKYYNLNVESKTSEDWAAREKAKLQAWYRTLRPIQKSMVDQYGIMASKMAKIDSDATKMVGKSYLEAESENMKLQQAALEEQVKAARKDNKKGKRNDEIKGYLKEIDDLNAKIAETQDKWYESLRGTDLQSAADSFATAWVDAFLSGEDAMDSFKGKFDEMMKTMIVKQAAMRVMSKIMQPLLDQIDKSIGVSGELNVEEVKGIISQLPDIMKNMDAGMKAIIQPLLEAAGLTAGSGKTVGGLSGEIKGVTEDTAQLLASLLNAIRGDVSVQGTILKSIEGLLGNTQSDMANSLAQLVKIESNTYNSMKLLESVIGRAGSTGNGIRVWA